MKIYHPCPRCYERKPIELSNIETWGTDITSVLRCQNCGFIYRIGKDGKSIDSIHRNVYVRKIRELSRNENLVNIFRHVEKNKWINISGLSKKLRTTKNSLIGEYVSELERNDILEVRYLRNSRILSIAETKAADLFKELI